MRRFLQALLLLLPAPSAPQNAVLARAAAPEPDKRIGRITCPCLDDIPVLANLTVNTLSNEVIRTPVTGGGPKAVQDCLEVKGVARLERPHEKYCYPTDYGRGQCRAWDERLLPLCARWRGPGGPDGSEEPEACRGSSVHWQQRRCEFLVQPEVMPLPWCKESWCYVDPKNCDLAMSESYYFPGTHLWYSYETCASRDYFELWNAVQLEMCQLFAVVEKPYVILWLSCWACAFMQQVIDTTRLLEESQDRLGKWQRLYMVGQLLVLVTETFANIQRIPWGKHSFWSTYNLYVYVFIHSSVFVRATMMSQIVWDWYEARLLRHPVLPNQLDGKGWTDEMRAGLLVIVFQFLSSLGVFGIITLTHLLPALVVYYWIFLIVAAGLVKSRSWLALIGLDPESRFGRALVMGTNSFMSCVGVQQLVTLMVRVYAGEWAGGYFQPLLNDFVTRRLNVWFTCHLGKGISVDILSDQDFINLWVR